VSLKKLGKKFLDSSEIYQNLVSLKRKIYSHEHPCQKIRDISNKQSDDVPKLLEKQEPTNPKSSRWKEIREIKAEINKLEAKKINETQCCFFEKINKIANLYPN
jgi:cell fate (sporulation/competence/biofilm development) regulator YlbF (YheA/YmcA/DUF963 family)